MGENGELDALIRRKYLKLQRRILARRLREKAGIKAEARQPSPEEVVKKALDGSGLRVLNALKIQYPREAKVIITALARALMEGRVPRRITGGMLYHFLLSLGLRVRLKTRIYVERRGEVKEFSEYLREKLKNS